MVEVFKDVPVERPVERVIEVVKEGIEFRRIYLSYFRAKQNIGCLARSCKWQGVVTLSIFTLSI